MLSFSLVALATARCAVLAFGLSGDADSADLVAPSRAPAFCEIAGRIDGGLELSDSAYGRSVARVEAGRATLSFSEGGTVFAEVRLLAYLERTLGRGRP